MTATLNTCRICGDVGEHPIFIGREMMFGTREEFEYFQCKSCGCLHISNIPTNLGKYYPDNYYSFDRDKEKVITVPSIRKILVRFRVGNALFGRRYKLNKFSAQLVDMPVVLNKIGPWLRKCQIDSWNARFLDIGCGSWSWWLQDLQTLGFKNLIGVDPYIKEDIELYGINIYKGSINRIKGYFDIITLHHSLEHIPSQVDTLKAVRNLLAPNGFCMIRIPLVSSLVWEKYGTDWVELDAPRHLYLHSLKSIEILGKKAGFKLVDKIWDSTEFEFIGSEQYRRGIPLFAENSFAKNPSLSDFTYREIAEFKTLAKQVNCDGLGGRGCFFFQAQD